MRSKKVVVLIFLAVASLACNAFNVETPTPIAVITPGTAEIPGPEDTPQLGQTPLVPPTAVPGSSPTPTTTPTETATATPSPTPTESECTLDAELVADITIPDDTSVQPGASFRKTWRVRNSGTCPWELGTRLAYDSGSVLNGPANVLVPATEPGAQVDVSVDLQAPEERGHYRSEWELLTPQGESFGSDLHVQIVVPGSTETPTPTEAPSCRTPDAQFSEIVEQAAVVGMSAYCATGDVTRLSGAAQKYRANLSESDQNLHYLSLMIWRSDTGKIYTVRGQDATAYRANINLYDDTWDASEPEVPDACDEMTPPEGYVLPKRGFGKVWCEHELWETLGWPESSEGSVTLTIQSTDRGVLMSVPIASETYLVAIDFETGMGMATVKKK